MVDGIQNRQGSGPETIPPPITSQERSQGVRDTSPRTSGNPEPQIVEDRVQEVEQESKDPIPKTEADNESCHQERFIGSSNSHFKQMEMLVFEGMNVNAWITRAKRYFDMGRCSESEKLRLAAMSIDRHVLSWYDYQNGKNPFRDWTDVRARMIKRFGEKKIGSPFDRLLSLRQTGTIEEYLCDFEELLAQVPHTPDPMIDSTFKNGLKPEIKEILQVFRPKGMDEIVDVALSIEGSKLSTVCMENWGEESKNMRSENLGSMFRTMSLSKGIQSKLQSQLSRNNSQEKGKQIMGEENKC
ncbi:PREDICTED: uncharacterized protein LOC104798668 [Tarenaya hassleriana]|uniref:uncharacterized protein LOC104798668 n=1 Tax=Tarenaya hassleriana TaxID=28532 RepID=UPI00053C9DD7|nr:PREDICTED: uncharacterized protein LOC104798668 [Tarenaya hassleriana]